MQRERLGSRLGFIFMGASCAIGLGNIWRFPFLAGTYGGGLFLLIFIGCMLLLALPIMAVEFTVGRASQKSIIRSFHDLQPKGTKWWIMGWAGLVGNYILMMFYTVIAGWMAYYFVKMIRGDFVNATPDQIGASFGGLLGSAGLNVGWGVAIILLGMFVCAMGLRKSVEIVTKIMMSGLMIILIILAIHGLTLSGNAEGLKFLFIPRLEVLQEHSLFTIIFAAMGQAFFSLSVGMGSMAIFGSYIGKERRLFGESVYVGCLDLSVSIMSGIVIFTAVFSYNLAPGAGPGLVFITLPNVFANMPLGRFWGSMFFLFISFAAFTTVIAVFENLVACLMDLFDWSRMKASIINIPIVILGSLPVALGFNAWSHIEPMGSGTVFLDLYDFILSNNILPLGSLVYVLFCMVKKGWGWDNFIAEVNTGNGLKFPTNIKWYFTYIVPAAIMLIFIMGYINMFK